MTRKERAMELAEQYNITVTGRHVHVTDGMKEHAIEKIAKLERFGNRIIDVYVTMDIQKLDHRVDILMKYGHTQICSHASTTDMYASIDQAVAKLENQLKRYKTKLQDHFAKGHPVVDMPIKIVPSLEEVSAVNDEIEEAWLQDREKQTSLPQVISHDTCPVKILSEDEAVMKMDLSGNHVMIYRSEEDRKIHVIYRRNDGHYGILLPESL